MIYFKALSSIIIGYLLGSISFATLIAKVIFKRDLSQEGSGNLGATNALRVLGTGPGLLVLFGDVFKGFLAIAIASHLFRGAPTAFTAIFNRDTTIPFSSFDSVVIIFVALAAIIGHAYPLFFNFKGGKGVAVSLGVFLGVMPKVGLILFFIWLIVMVSSGYVSLGSIIAAAAFPFLTLYFHQSNLAYLIFSLLVSFMVIYRHKSNIERLLSGKENRIGKKGRN
ncbi:MAG: glycerol-3-phosphate 1-O-acyltransferase PlsY [Actinomycetota bacterium]|nr:glycerol-3-phosphate 1-O-acyltransferase PlsY [Actinomycetota bacterium]